MLRRHARRAPPIVRGGPRVSLDRARRLQLGLADLQQGLDGRIRLPDLESLTNDQVDAIGRAAHILRGGGVFSDWVSLSLAELPEIPDGEGPPTLQAVGDETLVIGDVTTTLRVEHSWFEVDMITDDEGAVRVTPVNPPGRCRTRLAS